MFSLKENIEKHRLFVFWPAVVLTVLLVSVWFCQTASARFSSAIIWPSDAYKKETKAYRNPDHYKSPEGAIKSLVEALSQNDQKKLSVIFGPEGKTIISSGDETADKAARERFLQAYQEKNELVKLSGNKAILQIGNDAWPFPIPIVKKSGDGWYFDARQGKDELLTRRIGKNEINAIQVSLAYVDAQREYASRDRDRDGVKDYAQKFLSDPGTKNGLYWETAAGENESPLGPLVGQAQREGYRKKPGNAPSPYHGYYYRILKAQGRNAPRGAYDYVIDGRMVGGFAMVAYPAQYGASGINTFIVSQDGVVYEKDLGSRTSSLAQAMTTFDPDKSWSRVQSKYVDFGGKEDTD